MPMFSRLAILLLISACSAAPAVSPKPLSGAALRWCVLNPDRVLDAYDSSGAPTIRGNDLQALYLMVTTSPTMPRCLDRRRRMNWRRWSR